MSRILTISLCAKNSRENSLLHTRCRCAESSVLYTIAVQCGCVVHCAALFCSVVFYAMYFVQYSILVFFLMCNTPVCCLQCSSICCAALTVANILIAVCNVLRVVFNEHFAVCFVCAVLHAGLYTMCSVHCSAVCNTLCALCNAQRCSPAVADTSIGGAPSFLSSPTLKTIILMLPSNIMDDDYDRL